VVATISVPARIFLALARENEEEAFARIDASSFVKPVGELLRQGSVLAWTALEVLANDLFIQLLNAVPDLSTNLMEARTGNRFQLKRIPLEDLARFGFNLSDKMGALLADKQPLDSTAIIREVFEVLFPDSAELRTVLQNDRLWILYQNRNLILHRSGVIDKTYIANTGIAPALEGRQLNVMLRDVEDDLRLVRDVGIAMLQAAPSRLEIVPPER
jgi:phage tail protein X